MGAGVGEAARLQPGVADDKRHARAAFSGVALEQSERRAAGARPVRPEPHVAARPSHIGERVVAARRGRVGHGRPFRGHVVTLGAVVRHEDDDRVVQLTTRAQELEDAADVRVHVGDHGREDLHAAGFQGALGRGERGPRSLSRVRAIARGVGRRDPETLGGGEPRGEERVVAGVVGAAIAGQAVVWGLQREVGRAEGEIGEKRRVVGGRTLADVAHQGVGEEARGVEVGGQSLDELPVLAIRRLVASALDRLAIGEVTGPAGKQREAAVEAARRRTRGLVAAEMPLAGHVSAIAGLFQHRRQRRDGEVQMALVAGLVLLIRCQVLPHVAQSGHVRVGTAHQTGP